MMSVILFTFVLLIIAAAIAYRIFGRETEPHKTSRNLPARHFDGLFAEQRAQEVLALKRAEAELRETETRQRLLARAAGGERSALEEAHSTGDAQLYREALRRIYTRAENNPEVLQDITTHIVGSRKLRSSRDFAETMITRWSQSPNSRSLADVLYLAALADDAPVFKMAVDVALQWWREDQIAKPPAQDFLALVESAYWMISVEVRSSGSGFLLKQAIADVRRELAAANRRSAW